MTGHLAEGAVLGTGLRARGLGIIFTFSVLLFLFWDEPLWSVPSGGSHIGRILVSYGVVPPCVAIALLLSKRWSKTRLASSTAVIWSAKLVATSLLYGYLASGSGQTYVPAPVAEPTPLPSASALPETAPSRPARGSSSRLVPVSGHILRNGKPLPGVVVFATGQASAVLPVRDLKVSVAQNRYDRVIYVAHPQDDLLVLNRDAELHNLRIRKVERTFFNLPAPSGTKRNLHPFSHLPSGVYLLLCDTHSTERAALVLVDHEQVDITDGRGAFHLPQVLAGEQTLEVVVDAEQSRQVPLHVGAGTQSAMVDIEK